MIVYYTYIIVLNLVTYYMYLIDKRRAEKDEYRIPEAVLLGLSFIGGAFGAFCAMQEYRHKTLHKAFVIGVPIALLLHVALFITVAIHTLFR